MRRSLLVCLTIIGFTFASGTALAGTFKDFRRRCHVDFHRMNAWPQPFQTADRAAQREPFCIMTDNGWKMQNTVGTFLYDRDTQRLNHAGELLVRWIVTQAPQHRRAVFVLRADSEEATTARVESVQAAVAKYARGPVCPVILTDIEPTGWSAAYIDSITQQFNATIPSPRLPSASDSGGGSSGGGGSSQ
jgi:hypothetical protein